jgi:hypothetical protein
MLLSGDTRLAQVWLQASRSGGVCNGAAAQVARDIAEITGVQQAEEVTGPYMPAKWCPCCRNVVRILSKRHSQQRDNVSAAQGIGVSTLRHEPFGYQRLTTTLAL